MLRYLVVGALLLTPMHPLSAAQAADSATARRAFDFLLGSWRVTSVISGDSVTPSSGERYAFKRTLDGIVIEGFWRFNRGTPAAPDWTDAVYYSAFDPRSWSWTFYYVSPRSAQYWPGQLSEGRWYFTQNFTLDGKPMLQRQWWEPVNDSTVHRHIDNSADQGKTWTLMTIVLRRTGR
jgi:hypothetical protein